MRKDFMKAFLEFQVVEVRLEDAQGPLPVVELGAGLGILDHYAGGDVAHADAGLDLVDVLAAGSGRAVGVPLEVRRIDFYFDSIVHERVDEDG